MNSGSFGDSFLGDSSSEIVQFIQLQLADAYLFCELDDSARELLSKQCKVIYKHSGEIIDNIGDEKDSVYFLLKGIVKMEGISRTGDVTFFSLLKAGDSIGVMEVVAEEKVRHGRATSFTESALLQIDAVLFRQLMHQHSKFAVKVSRQLSHRLSHMMKAYAELTTKDVASRLKSALQFLCFSFGEPKGDSIQIDLQITQNELAHLINSTRQTTNKYLKLMERLGIVDISIGLDAGLLVNPEKLQQFDPEAN